MAESYALNEVKKVQTDIYRVFTLIGTFLILIKYHHLPLEPPPPEDPPPNPPPEEPL